MHYDFFVKQWGLGFKIFDVKADGHCGLHAFMRSGCGRCCTPYEVTAMRQQIRETLIVLSKDAAWRLAFFVTEGLGEAKVAIELD